MSINTFSIFISSPGDVEDERQRADRVIRKLQVEFDRYIRLEPIFWEHQPQSAQKHFQEQIKKLPSETDLLVCILWSRLGTRLPSDKFCRVDGTPYRSGTEFEFEDAVEGYRRSSKTPDLWVYRKTDPHIYRDVTDADIEEHKHQKAILDDFLNHWLGSAQDNFKAGFNDFIDSDDFEHLFYQHLRTALQERCPHISSEEVNLEAWTRNESPYRGLAYFDVQHSSIFHGRDVSTQSLITQLQAQSQSGKAFVLLLGASGSGKSSLARSGVLNSLVQKNQVNGIDHWRYSVFRPSEGSDGELIHAFAKCLLTETALPELHVTGFGDPTVLAEQFANHPAGLYGPLAKAMEKAGERMQTERHWKFTPVVRLIVIIDQMEELFRTTTAEREHFVSVIEALATTGLVWVLACMRSDFYPRCAELPKLAAMMEGAGQFMLLPPTVAEIGEIIRYPARSANVRFEIASNGKSLDDTLQEAAARDPASLPLLEFTLDHLYRAKVLDENGAAYMTFEAYNKWGGLEGSIANHAEQLVGEYPAAQIAALRSVFRNLVALHPDNPDQWTRRRVLLAEFADKPLQKEWVERLINARLLTSELDQHQQAAIEIVHEALLCNWQRLQEWLQQDKRLMAVRDQIRRVMKQEPSEIQEKPAYLEGKLLSEAQELLCCWSSDLDQHLRDFILSSIRVEQRKGIGKWYFFAAIYSICIILYIWGSGFFSGFRYSIENQQSYQFDIARKENPLFFWANLAYGYISTFLYGALFYWVAWIKWKGFPVNVRANKDLKFWSALSGAYGLTFIFEFLTKEKRWDIFGGTGATSYALRIFPFEMITAVFFLISAYVALKKSIEARYFNKMLAGGNYLNQKPLRKLLALVDVIALRIDIVFQGLSSVALAAIPIVIITFVGLYKLIEDERAQTDFEKNMEIGNIFAEINQYDKADENFFNAYITANAQRIEEPKDSYWAIAYAKSGLHWGEMATNQGVDHSAIEPQYLKSFTALTEFKGSPKYFPDFQEWLSTYKGLLLGLTCHPFEYFHETLESVVEQLVNSVRQLQFFLEQSPKDKQLSLLLYQAHFSLGSCLLEQNNSDEAQAHFQAANLLLKDLDETLTSAIKQIEQTEGDQKSELAELYGQLSGIHLFMGDPQSAINYANKAISLDSNQLQFKSNLFIGYLLNNQQDDARQLFIFSVSPDNLNFFQQVASDLGIHIRNFSDKGNLVGAQHIVENFANVIEDKLRHNTVRNPSFGSTLSRSLSTVHQINADFHLLNKDYKGAIMAAKRAIQFAPSDHQSQVALAHGYLFDGQVDKAKSLYAQLKDIPAEKGKFLRDTILKDFDMLRFHSLGNPEMERVAYQLARNVSVIRIEEITDTQQAAEKIGVQPGDKLWHYGNWSFPEALKREQSKGTNPNEILKTVIEGFFAELDRLSSENAAMTVIRDGLPIDFTIPPLPQKTLGVRLVDETIDVVTFEKWISASERT